MLKHRTSNENDTVGPHHRQDQFAVETGFKEKFEKLNEKSLRIYRLYAYLAPFYDIFLNTITLGLQRILRKIIIERLAPTKNTQLVDMAGGTGITAFCFLDYIKEKKIEENCHVTVCDINEDMLKAGKDRMKAEKYDQDLMSWVQDDAENLSFKDESFSAYTISYALEYCLHPDKVLDEAYRILKPGGKFLSLETGRTKNKFFRLVFQIYVRSILRMAHYIGTGDDKFYQNYLEGDKQWTEPGTFKTMIEKAGFVQASYEHVLYGSVVILTAVKPQVTA